MSRQLLHLLRDPMSHIKVAKPDYPILETITQRWSPYSYDGRPVEKEKLRSCLEAARWAASSYNEQPWRFLVAERGNAEEFGKALGCLLEANQVWAKNAGVLMLTAISRNFVRNNNPNRVAEHDLGQAAAYMALQATALGLQMHQMAGISPSKARLAYSVPDGFDVITGIAIGYPGETPDEVDRELMDRDMHGRTRKPIHEIAFTGHWSNPLS